MKKSELTVRKLNNTNFDIVYGDFLIEKNMSTTIYLRMLSLATLFLNCQDENIKRLGYRIIVIYCNQTNDYKPLYEIAVNLGLIPISQFIESHYISKRNVYTELNAAVSESFFISNVYCSIQQKELINFYNFNTDETVSVVAPTSYGKTDLILSTIETCKNKNICVVTPTKSLLAQTKMRVMQSKTRWIKKIITHPEMYNGKEENVVAIVTQERLLRLLKKDEKLNFDYIIIDEAHGLLHDDSRNLLLASVILILEKRNPSSTFKFLTPFLCEPSNMKVRYADYQIKTYKVNEYIKTEKIFLADFREYRNDFFIYDQFINKFFRINLTKSVTNDWSFVKKYSSNKNIVYLNKPKDIEAFVKKVCKDLLVRQSNKIIEACNNIAEYVHPHYRMIECLKCGIIYHHGSVPEPIRIYIEKLYSELSEISYVITSSTLLEGVNLPADSMFILDNKKGRGNLTPSDFKNLIGRVCRFSQIFQPKTGSLKKLEPHIYLVAGDYYSKNANVHQFLKTTMNVENKINDTLENVLLENTEITNDNDEKLDTAEEFIENYEGGIIENYDLRRVETEVGKSCFINNITEFDIFDSEEEIQTIIEKVKSKGNIITNTTQLFNALYKLFFKRVDDENIKRFEHEETRNFYRMFMDWRITNASLNYMISSFMKYWKSLISDSDKEKFVFVGSRWGDQKRNGYLELWTDISQKSYTELINLAIVRIKEEQDFLDNTVIKYIEVLNDMDILEENLYLNIKYGTTDKRIIVCVKNGISLSLAKLLVEKYDKYISIDLNNDIIQFKEGIVDEMEAEGENKIMINELTYNL